VNRCFYSSTYPSVLFFVNQPVPIQTLFWNYESFDHFVELRWQTVRYQRRTIQKNMNIHPAPQVWFQHVISVFEQSKTVHTFDNMAAVIGSMHTLIAKSYIGNSQFTSYMKNHTLVHTVRLQAKVNKSYGSSNFFIVNVRIYSSCVLFITLTFKVCSRGGIVHHRDQKEWLLLHCCLSCLYLSFVAMVNEIKSTTSYFVSTR
jgi:hypothetical protein